MNKASPTNVAKSCAANCILTQLADREFTPNKDGKMHITIPYDADPHYGHMKEILKNAGVEYVYRLIEEDGKTLCFSLDEEQALHALRRNVTRQWETLKNEAPSGMEATSTALGATTEAQEERVLA